MLPILRRRTARRLRRPAAVLAGAAVVAGVLSAVAAAPASAEAVSDPASYVNPFVGTGNGGGQVGAVNEFPGPDAPFGMIQWGPDTGPTGSLAGYYYPDTTIDGFSLTRLGGVGCSIFEDFRFLPTAKAVTTSPGTSGGWDGYTSGFSHGDESAKAGYYSVTTANGIQTQLTTATRAALGEFTYPAGSPATMLINASSSYSNTASTLQITSPDTISGSANGGEFCGHTTQRYTVYFTVTFSQPFASYGTWQGATATAGGTSVSGGSAGGWVSFGASSAAQTVNARVAISYVSVAGAQTNLATIGSEDFATVQAQTYQQWNNVLGKIDVSGGTADEMTTFYTALYHAFLDPSIYSDADGQYMGFDFKVHTVPQGHAEYTNFSGWDIYRSEVPLLALLDPGAASDMMQSLVNDAEQGGWLPKWPTADVYTGMVGGDSADPIIAEAYAFGARDFNQQAALQYMIKGADDTTGAPGQEYYVPRSSYATQAGWEDYLADGYVPTGSASPDGTSVTEEFAVDDFSIGQFAAANGDPADAATFQQRGQNWQNVLDPAAGYVMPRGPQAPTGGDPATQTTGFEEGDAAQYTWMIPQNLSGLFTALGGDATVNSDLDSYFSQLNAGASAPYDWQGNEVTLNDAWEYDYSGQPWQTQDVTRDVITQLYGPTPGGEPGNDDLGAMSSWYVWAALGVYPETPGTSTLALGSPLFPQAVVHLGNGSTLTINAPQAAADAPYIQSMTVNGQAWSKNYLSAAQYAQGDNTLNYTLGTTPDTSRGTATADAPPSYTQGEAPAIGYTSPWGGVTANRGTTRTVQVSAQSEVNHPQTLSWSTAAPSGVKLTPSSGTLTLGPGQHASEPAAVTVTGSSVQPGQYSIPITYTGQAGNQIGTASLYVQVPPLLSVSTNTTDLDLAAGGWNQASYTITNNQVSAPVNVTLSSQGPPGVTATLSQTSAQVPAGGSVKVTASFTNPSVAAGSGAFTVTAADAPDGVTLTSSTELHFTSDLALNAYGTPFPAATAPSQSGYPASNAVDGNTSTWWTSGGPAPTPSSPADFEDNLGTPVTIGSVTMTPRPGYGPTDYTIQASTDGQNWTTIGTVTAATSSGPTTTTVTPTTAQYVRLEMTGTYQGSGQTDQVEEIAIAAPPPEIGVTTAQPNLNLAAGGWNQATYTITNNQATTADVTFSGSAPPGVTDTLSQTSAQIPAGGSVQVTADLTDANSSTGSGTFTLSATNAADSVAGVSYTELYFTSDMTLNTYGSTWPAMSATSNQAPFPPSYADDGNTSTYWVSGNPAPTPSTPLFLEANFGTPVSIASVSMLPRPGYGPKDYTIQTSDDGQNWTTVATVTGAASTGATTTAITPAVTAQYVRLLMTDTYQGSGLTDQIAELTVTSS